ncbi:ankyrin repeat-containing domain protein [Tuber brumale]|nr:ankyrin repeat-containing domain protein [Tuber brumale]
MPFLTLPNEILLEISYWQSLADQNSLFRTNKRLAHLLPHVLLDTIFRTRSKENGRRALFHYASRNDTASVRALLDRGMISIAGTAASVIIAAMETEDEITLQTLLDCGVSARSVGDCGLAPIQFAARSGRAAMMRVLLSKEGYGIDVNAASVVQPTALIYAARSGSQEIIHMLLGHPGIEVNVLGPHGSSALNSAILNSNVHTVELLIGDSRVDVSTRHGTIWNPLMSAVWRRNREIVELLLRSRRVDVSEPGPDGLTALHMAVDNDDTRILKLLLMKPIANLNAQTITGTTPLHRACTLNRAAVRVLLDDGRADVNARDIRNSTPLHEAVWAKNMSIIRMLVQDLRVNISIEDHVGCTPLAAARYLNDGNILAVLHEEYSRRWQMIRRSACGNMTITPSEVA